MAKKQKHLHFNKPSSSYIHPSLTSRGRAQGSGSESRSSSSVNERIEHLRRIQGHVPVSKQFHGLQASRHAPIPAGGRQAAGPPPPRSWVVGTDENCGDEHDKATNLPQPRLSRLPGVPMPGQGTLMDVCMRSLARDFEWHVAFDYTYLSVLPMEIKVQLLSYVAQYSSRTASRAGLQCLFADPQESTLEESTGAYEATRLDLARSLGRTMRFSDLDHLWIKRRRPQDEKSKHDDPILESWEDDHELNTLSLNLPLRFPRLTHLSLAHPSENVSWQEFITFSGNLGSLTHLCLDFWPQPSLPTMQSSSTRNKSLLDHPIVRPDQSDGSVDTAILLRLLSRNTPSLRWLSFAGCHSWFDALVPKEDESELSRSRGTALLPRATDDGSVSVRLRSRDDRIVRFDERDNSSLPTDRARGADWNGAWRNVRYVNVSQDWIPRQLKRDDLVPLIMHRKARSANREALRAEPFRPPREQEEYRLSSSSDEVQRQIQERLQRNRWLLKERMSIYLAASIDRKRMQGHLPSAEFDFGWGREELLEAGYEEQMVFDAGL